MIDLVRAWLEKRAILQPVNLTVEPFSASDSEDSDSVDASERVVFNGGVALVENHWGFKPGQIAFVVYEKQDEGWTRVSNHDVEWRGPKREPKTPVELEVAYTTALDSALIQVVATLLEMDCK